MSKRAGHFYPVLASIAPRAIHPFLYCSRRGSIRPRYFRYRNTEREGFRHMNRKDGIHLDALAAALGETGDTALDIVRGTGIPLPKILRLLGLSTASRAAPALDGLEIVQLCLYAEFPLSAVMDAEEGQ